MKAIQELWYGNVQPESQSRERGKCVKELMKYLADHHDNLLSTLTDKQKEVLKKLDDCYDELTDINERNIFTYAFRLGAKMAIEIMSFEAD